MLKNTSKLFYLFLAITCLAFNGNPSRQYGAMVNSVNTRQYKGETKQQYFFNARKNPATGKMDYAAMLNCQQQIERQRRMHNSTGVFGLNWTSLGPDNFGGPTWAILIDNRDKTGNTIFAGGVCGGLWKSINGGNSWDSIATNMSNGCINCFAQDSAGVIYVGTGMGFDEMSLPDGDGYGCGMLGGGIFKSTDDGKTFTLLTATIPSISNSTSPNWAYTNRIAVNPKNPQVIYAATNRGLMVSIDGGNTFNYATNSVTSAQLNGEGLGLKISADGLLVVTCVGGIPYYAYPTSTNNYQQTKFTEMRVTGYDSIASAGGDGRIEFDIAPGNHDYVYASVVEGYGPLLGIFMTTNGLSSGNGGTWHEILKPSVKGINPYVWFNGAGQGTYDNAIAVMPNNPGAILVGGISVWAWSQSSTTDTVGTWQLRSNDTLSAIGTSNYVFPVELSIAINPSNSNDVYIGTQGGIYKSTDGAKTFQPAGRGYNTTEFYSIAFSPVVNTVNQEGVMGGVDQYGTAYISGNFFNPQDGYDLLPDNYLTGGQCAISQLNPNIYFITDYCMISSSNTLSSFATPSSLYVNSNYATGGANIDSAWNTDNGGCWVSPMVLYESHYDTATLDSMTWVAGKNYNAGDTIYPISPNGNTDFPYILSKPVATGDSIHIQNRVISKIATGFSASAGVWLMMQADNFTIPAPIWMPIGGPLSKPDAFTGAFDYVHCMAWSPNGDALFVGTEGGQFFRFSNLDSIIDTSYNKGGLYLKNDSKIANTACKVISTSLTAVLNDGREDILSITVDPKNGNNIIVTTGGYVGGTHVYYSNNALASSGVTFQSIQGNLPQMPVYCAVLDVINSPYPNGAVIGTEHGVYSCPDVTVPSPVWTPDNNGMANTIVSAMKQQTLPPWNCNNSGDIYMASGGRGLYVDTSFFMPTGIQQVSSTGMGAKLGVYPNPMNASGTITYTLPEAGKAIITIYDIEGRVVKEIPLQNQAPGQHTISINTSDVSVGTYIATLSGNNYHASTKFIVAR